MNVSDVTINILRNDKELQKSLFEAMILTLEEEGCCRRAFHMLAKVLFDDDLTDNVTFHDYDKE